MGSSHRTAFVTVIEHHGHGQTAACGTPRHCWRTALRALGLVTFCIKNLTNSSLSSDSWICGKLSLGAWHGSPFRLGNASSRQQVFIFFPASFLLLPIFTSFGSSRTCAVIQHGTLALGRRAVGTWGLELSGPGWRCSYTPPLRDWKPAAWPP